MLDFGFDKGVKTKKKEQELKPFAKMAQVQPGPAEEADCIGYPGAGLDLVACVGDGLLNK